MCLLGVVILGFLKRYLVIITSKTTYDIYQEQVNTTSELYFNIPGWAHLKEQNDEILNIVFNLTGLTAHYYVCVVRLVITCIPMGILIIAASLSSIYLTIIAMFIGFLTVMINYRNFNKMQAVGDEQQSTQQNVINELYQNILSFELIKFDQLQQPILKKIKQVIQQDWNWRVQRRTTTANANVMSDSIGLIAILILAGANTLIINGPVETFIVLILLLNRMRAYTSEFQSSMLEVRGSLPSVLKSLEASNRLKQYSKQVEIKLNKLNQVKFNNVNFSYGDKPLLKNINLHISPGEWVLLSGPSGEGKSTLLKMTTGYFVPDSGTILLNDAESPIQQLDFNSIQQHLFYCHNDLYLPNTSLKEAIDRSHTLTDDQICDVIHKSCLTELLNTSESLNLPIGENASNLSEGQRQRLILSRIFLKDPKLVILDESTSNLDQQTETNVFKNIRDHLDPKSIVIISAHKIPADILFEKTLKIHQGELQQNTLAV
tara:strand:- start:1400 stop:2866 length:1467 start_codon:yes stop_codon:yes gene_type:complete